MKLFDKVVVIGAGLIGGSLAWAIKNRELSSEVIGVTQHKESWQWAKKIGAIDNGSCKISVAKDAQLLILATPISTIIKLASRLSEIIDKGCLVMDVGSTKREVVSVLEKTFTNYVGSHPLAGSEKRGIFNANPDLFKGSICILTPTKNTRQENIKRIQKLWSLLGTRVVVMSPELHDKILSFSSHLPHIVAFALINAIPTDYLRFGSTGLRDTTRIAGSNSYLWADIFLSNSKNIINSIQSLQHNLLQIKSAIQRVDRKTLIKILRRAKQRRQRYLGL
ncbi:MAG: prephenate dehydrogenase [Candidatus Omnitrophica bacterium]|nr:prephenate dehydrogenase [Candidatus Omnitrophota bacterium]